MEHRREFIENFAAGKQFGKFLEQQNMQKRPQAPKTYFLDLESEKYGNQVPNFGIFLNI